MYDALLKRRAANNNRERLNFGILAAMQYNTAWGDPDRKPLKAEDFLPEKPVDLNEPEDLRELSPEEQKNYFIRMFMGAGRSSMR